MLMTPPQNGRNRRYDNSLQRLPHLAQFWLKANWRLYALRHQPVIVYQMGGVGSNSVYNALDEAGAFVFHAHRLSAEAVEPGRYKPRSWRWLRHHVIVPRRSAKLIALVRDPVSVKLSGFFKTLDRSAGQENAHEHYTIEQLLNRFHDRVGRSSFHFEWFDREVKPVIGIDVYSQPFPHEAGYMVYRQEPYELLVMRSKLPDERKAEIITEFTGVPVRRIGRDNTTAARAHAATRREFEAQLRFPPEQIDQWMQTRFMRHFFTQAERDALLERWRDPR